MDMASGFWWLESCLSQLGFAKEDREPTLPSMLEALEERTLTHEQATRQPDLISRPRLAGRP